MPLKDNMLRQRNVRLDILRVLAIVECIISHALLGESMSQTDYLWIIVFFPDTAAMFIMASGAIILERPRSGCGWRYVAHRIMSFLPEFVLFSALYVFLNRYYGLIHPDSSVVQELFYMLITPTWGPGWFILALMGVYFVAPLLSAWVHSAGKREIEIGLLLWMCATLLPAVMPHTPVDVPLGTFGTLFNYAGYMVLGYYLVHWPLSSRSNAFKTAYFIAAVGIGVVFGFFLARSGAKWGYMPSLISGLSINIVMVSLLQFGIVMMMPERWFKGIFARIVSFLSILSLGIYCCHWLVIGYWAIPQHVGWCVATLVALAVSIPVACVMRWLRKTLTAAISK